MFQLKIHHDVKVTYNSDTAKWEKDLSSPGHVYIELAGNKGESIFRGVNKKVMLWPVDYRDEKVRYDRAVEYQKSSGNKVLTTKILEINQTQYEKIREYIERGPSGSYFPFSNDCVCFVNEVYKIAGGQRDFTELYTKEEYSSLNTILASSTFLRFFVTKEEAKLVYRPLTSKAEVAKEKNVPLSRVLTKLELREPKEGQSYPVFSDPEGLLEDFKEIDRHIFIILPENTSEIPIHLRPSITPEEKLDLGAETRLPQWLMLDDWDHNYLKEKREFLAEKYSMPSLLTASAEEIYGFGLAQHKEALAKHPPQAVTEMVEEFERVHQTDQFQQQFTQGQEFAREMMGLGGLGEDPSKLMGAFLHNQEDMDQLDFSAWGFGDFGKGGSNFG